MIVVADRLPEQVTAGQALALDVHVVSDLRTQVDDAEVTAALHWTAAAAPGDGAATSPPTACQRVGTVQIVVPDAPGPMALVLHCHHDGQQVDNRYEATIAR